MNVFLAGGSGAIGVPLVRQLIAGGHEVTSLTRSVANASMLRGLGATPAIADALDADALRAVVVAARPTHVIHELTALPKMGPRNARDLIPTNRLRIEGTRNLIAAALAAGARRVIGGSFAPLAGSSADDAATAVRSMESQILEASRSGAIEGVVLRYGLFYGPENPSTVQTLALVRRRFLPTVRGDRGQLPFIHVEDAASATVAALEHGSAGSTYDIVDNQAVSMSEFVQTLALAAGARRPIAIPSWLLRLAAPYMARVAALRVPLSNEKARAELGWRPAFPTIHEGLRQTLQQAA